MKRLVVGIISTGLLAAFITGCGGGTSTGGSLPSTGTGSSGTGTGGTGTGGTSPKATPTPTAAATATATAKATSGPSSVPTGTPVPTATPVAGGAQPGPTAPANASGYANATPAPPTGTSCRAGTQYNIGVTSGPTDISSSGTTEVFTVFEPTSICGGKTYPIIFNGPGFGGSRDTTASDFSSFLNAGYGVVSVDEAGEGNDGGKIRVMDPDQEGVMLLAVMNWVQAKIPWVAYGPTNDGKDPHEPIFGTDGGSYGGMYQFMLMNIDTRHRIRAMVPQITPHNLNFSLFPGGAIKTLWNLALFGDGESAGSGLDRGNFDNFVTESLVSDEAANAVDPYLRDFMNYHSADYFCNGQTIATNGGAGTAPWLPPATAPPKVNAMVWIGIRDTLFDFNNGYNNYKCLQQGGGDVRLFSYQTGHNAQLESGLNGVGVVPDPYLLLFPNTYPNNDSLDARCGTLSEATAELDWFNAYLKGQTGALSGIATQPCVSMVDGDGVTFPQIPTMATTPNVFKSFNIGSPIVISGDATQVPTSVSLYTAPAGGAIIAGLPHINFDVSPTAGVSTGTPIIFVGVGILHANSNTVWDLMDNQVYPLRGVGNFNVDIIGGGARLLPGDQLGLLIYGLNDQFAGNGDISIANPTVEPITVTGNMYLPILPSTPSNI